MRHILKHSGRYVYRHEDLIAIAGECGGQILSLFEFWTSCRMAEQDRVRSQNKQLAAKGKSPTKEPDNWLLETIEDIRAGLMDGWGISSIKRALKQLVDANYVLEGKAKNPWLRTKTYQLNIPEVQKALDAWQNRQSSVLAEAQNPVVPEQLNSTHRGVDFNSSSGCFEPQTIYNNNPLKHSQPMGQQSQGVCGEEEGKEEQIQSPFVQPPTSGVTSTRNDPEKSSTLGGGAVLSAKWDSVESLIESILVDPYLAATDPIPSVCRSDMRLRGWLFPWRSHERNGLFGTCNPALVEKKARDWAAINKDSEWKNRIQDVLGWVTKKEATKGGLEELMSLWMSIQQKNPSLPQQQTSQQTNEAKNPDVDPDITLETEWRHPVTKQRMRFIAPLGRVLVLIQTGNIYQWALSEKFKFAETPAPNTGGMAAGLEIIERLKAANLKRKEEEEAKKLARQQKLDAYNQANANNN